MTAMRFSITSPDWYGPVMLPNAYQLYVASNATLTRAGEPNLMMQWTSERRPRHTQASAAIMMAIGNANLM